MNIFNVSRKLSRPIFKKQNELGAASFLTYQMEVVKLFQDKRFPFCDLAPEAKFCKARFNQSLSA